jgi:hypothetical protein
LIALDTNSIFKKQFVQWLLSLDAKVESFELISRQSLLGLMEIVKMCTYIDNQLFYYKSHKTKYFEFKEDDNKWDEFDKFRNSLLKLGTTSSLNAKYFEKVGKIPTSKLTKIEKLAIVDALESIRSGLFDFLSMQFEPYTSKNIHKAKDLADFVKKMFDVAGIDNFDFKGKGYDRNGIQYDLFRKVDDIDLMLISQTIKLLHNQN